jgi:hypothetical protein
LDAIDVEATVEWTIERMNDEREERRKLNGEFLIGSWELDWKGHSGLPFHDA